MMPETLTTDDGLALHWRRWPTHESSPEAARGTVLLVHGLGEHIGRYEHVAARLNAWGWNVAGFDHRGHGRSPGARGGLPRPDAMLRDVASALDRVRQSNPRRLVLLGHSLGGLIAARFVAEALRPQPAAWSRPVDALVLSSPALDPGMNAFQKLLLAMLGPLAPNLAVHNGLKPAWISRAPAVVQAYVADPLVHDRITPALVRFIVDAGALVRAAAPHWRVTTLLLYAGADRCVAPAGSAAFTAAARAAGLADAVLAAREFGPLYHEIFNEPEADEVFATLQTWLDARP
jgi:alpha-beta hydrolase superfamily lysophospholipase